MFSKLMPATIILLIFFTIFISFTISGKTAADDDEEASKTIVKTGSSSENSDSDVMISIDSDTVKGISAVLSWDDREDDSGSFSTNEPDYFSVSITSPSSELSEAGSESPSGTTTADLTVPEDSIEESGDWIITVICGECGDVYGLGGILLISSDTGNSWSLEVTYTYVNNSGPPPSYGPPPNIQAVLDSPIFKIHIFLMISSTFLFLGTGILAGIYLFSRTPWSLKKLPWLGKLGTTKPFLVIAMLVFIMFFIASVPIGMWVAGMYYGWANAWSGIPAVWNPDAFSMTNADNVSSITLLLWVLPLYFNRSAIMNSPLFNRLFGWSRWLMKRAASAPAPLLTERELGFMYFIMGIFVYTVFMVQPHG